MIKSFALPSRARIRQDRSRKAPLALVASTLALALTIPTAALAAPGSAGTTVTTAAPTALDATAATNLVRQPVSKVKPKLKVKRSAARQVRGETRVKISVRAKHKGKNVAGKVDFRLGKKVLKTKKLKKGRASVKLPKKLKRGTKKIKVTFRPTAKTASPASGKVLSETSRTIRVKVISQGKAIKIEALKHVGVRYRHGGTSPRSGFDCSGFVRHVYKKAGIANLPTSSSSQRYAGKVVSRSKAKVGDIIWSPGHVGIYLGGNKQIDAPRPGKTIQVRSIWQSSPVFINV